MLDIEIAASWFMALSTIFVAAYITIKVDKIIGSVLLFCFVTFVVQQYILSHTDIVQWIFSAGHGELITPSWYKAFMAIRSIVSVFYPIALFMLARKLLKYKQSANNL